MSKQAILELDHDACKTQAMAYLEQGFNCAQAVACTLAPAIGLDVDQTFRLMEGFGGGMGGYTETCGAVSGAVMATGWVKSAGSETPSARRKRTSWPTRCARDSRRKTAPPSAPSSRASATLRGRFAPALAASKTPWASPSMFFRRTRALASSFTGTLRYS
ncbi:C-GCAxxG-C-C family (seleno)protein [Senegalimassilia anaerobia]|uniref:C-GCAxxG-C-C family (seleno)protein n=1 Tax=Senegalimassilia anaerobia TaxID=1473216 RepID=UPI003F5CF07F